VVICFEYTCRNIEYGFAEKDKPHVPGTFSPKAHKAIVGLVQAIRDETQRRKWPQIYFFPIDKPGNNKTENRHQFAERVLDFVHEVPGCKTAVTVTADCVRRLGSQRIDARIYGPLQSRQGPGGRKAGASVLVLRERNVLRPYLNGFAEYDRF
jgi:hypothetical protein